MNGLRTKIIFAGAGLIAVAALVLGLWQVQLQLKAVKTENSDLSAKLAAQKTNADELKELADLQSANTALAQKLQEQEARLVEGGKGPRDLLPELAKQGLSPYQAVHLKDGNVYFGKVTKYNTDILVLEDIFYIKEGYSDTKTTESISLVKRGAELHGPKDEMTITTASLSFVENMKSDSRILMAIEAYYQQ